MQGNIKFFIKVYTSISDLKLDKISAWMES